MAIRKITADLIYPISTAPSAELVIITNEDGVILELANKANFQPAELEYYPGRLCPGFVNAHCHLELSHLRNKIPRHTGLVGFIQSLMQQRTQVSVAERLSAIANAEDEMLTNGIVAVGDISNEAITLEQKAKHQLYYHTFIESYGMAPWQADEKMLAAIQLFNQFKTQGAASLAPHANYSVSKSLFRSISAFTNENNLCTSLHNQETADEDLLYLNKSGAFISFYKNLGLDISFFESTGLTALQSVIGYLPSKQPLQLVHNSFTSQADMEAMMQHNPNTFWCACPQANLFIENRLPDYTSWIKNNLSITMGTDSLASNTGLSVWDEIQTIHKHQTISLETLLPWATLNGAKFLGIEDWAGSFDVGKQPGINWVNKEGALKVIG